MANLRSAIITQAGINAIYNGQLGPHFALKYFLPVYDPRIDDQIHTLNQTTTSASGVEVQYLSATIDESDTYSTIEGEKIFNAESQLLLDYYGGITSDSVYSLGSDFTYVYTSATNIDFLGDSYSSNPIVLSGGVENSSQYTGTKANLINGVSAMSGLVSAATLSGNSLGDFEGLTLEMDRVGEPAFELIPTDVGAENVSATSLLYQIDGYTRTEPSNGISSGQYRLVLGPSVGNFRFNKIIMFATGFTASRTDDFNVLPVPFAEIAFEGTQLKTTTDANNNNLLWESVITLSFTTSAGQDNLTNLVVSNWSDTTSAGYGLTTSQKVTIYSSGASPAGTSVAKFTVENDNVDHGIDVRYVDATTIKDNYIIATSAGNLELSASNKTLVRSGLEVEDGADILFRLNEGGSGNKLSISSVGAFLDPMTLDIIANNENVDSDFLFYAYGDDGGNQGKIRFAGAALELSATGNVDVYASFNAQGESYFWDASYFLETVSFSESATFNEDVVINDTLKIGTNGEILSTETNNVTVSANQIYLKHGSGVADYVYLSDPTDTFGFIGGFSSTVRVSAVDTIDLRGANLNINSDVINIYSSATYFTDSVTFQSTSLFNDNVYFGSGGVISAADTLLIQAGTGIILSGDSSTDSILCNTQVQINDDLYVNEGQAAFYMRDNQANTFIVKESTNDYIVMNTANGLERITIGDNSLRQDVIFYGDVEFATTATTVTFDGKATFGGSIHAGIRKITWTSGAGDGQEQQLTDTDYTIINVLDDGPGGYSHTIKLPPEASNTDRIVVITCSAADANSPNLTLLNISAANQIGGVDWTAPSNIVYVPDYNSTNYTTMGYTLHCDGSNWIVVSTSTYWSGFLD